ncbi:MAG: hypothetical protein WCS94_21935 [Verrucomicrobiota bacterium]
MKKVLQWWGRVASTSRLGHIRIFMDSQVHALSILTAIRLASGDMQWEVIGAGILKRSDSDTPVNSLCMAG